MANTLPADTGTTVYAHNSNGNIEKMLRKFKKRMVNTGILNEYKERQYYTKPSVVNRLKLKKAIFDASHTTCHKS